MGFLRLLLLFLFYFYLRLNRAFFYWLIKIYFLKLLQNIISLITTKGFLFLISFDIFFKVMFFLTNNWDKIEEMLIKVNAHSIV